jgi:hypothetical protein
MARTVCCGGEFVKSVSPVTCSAKVPAVYSPHFRIQRFSVFPNHLNALEAERRL